MAGFGACEKKFKQNLLYSLPINGATTTGKRRQRLGLQFQKERSKIFLHGEKQLKRILPFQRSSSNKILNFRNCAAFSICHHSLLNREGGLLSSLIERTRLQIKPTHKDRRTKGRCVRLREGERPALGRQRRRDGRTKRTSDLRLKRERRAGGRELFDPPSSSQSQSAPAKRRGKRQSVESIFLSCPLF